MSWTKVAALKLIELYGQHPNLYEITSTKYKNKHARSSSLEAIRNEIDEIRPGTTVTEIKAKYNMMRQTYLQERKKVVSSKKSGAGAADVYIPNLYYFEVMDKLLRGSGIDARASTDTIVDEPQDPIDFPSDNENIILEFSEMNDEGSRSPGIISPVTSHIATLQSKTPKRLKKKILPGDKILQDASAAMQGICNAMEQRQQKTPKDRFDVFGEYIAMRLRAISGEALQNEAELNIITIINNISQ